MFRTQRLHACTLAIGSIAVCGGFTPFSGPDSEVHIDDREVRVETGNGHSVLIERTEEPPGTAADSGSESEAGPAADTASAADPPSPDPAAEPAEPQPDSDPGPVHSTQPRQPADTDDTNDADADGTGPTPLAGPPAPGPTPLADLSARPAESRGPPPRDPESGDAGISPPTPASRPPSEGPPRTVRTLDLSASIAAEPPVPDPTLRARMSEAGGPPTATGRDDPATSALACLAAACTGLLVAVHLRWGWRSRVPAYRGQRRAPRRR